MANGSQLSHQPLAISPLAAEPLHNRASLRRMARAGKLASTDDVDVAVHDDRAGEVAARRHWCRLGPLGGAGSEAKDLADVFLARLRFAAEEVERAATRDGARGAARIDLRTR